MPHFAAEASMLHCARHCTCLSVLAITAGLWAAGSALGQTYTYAPPVAAPCPPPLPMRSDKPGTCEHFEECFEDHVCRIDLDPPLCCGDARYDREPRTIVDFECPHDEPHLPDPLAIPLHTLNPAVVQFSLERAFYFDVERFSPFDATPAIPDAILYDQAGSLGVLKYHNEANYTVFSLGGDLPTVQRVDLEYAPHDWTVLSLDVLWQEDGFERVVPGVEVTLGTGANGWGHWAHGVELAVSHSTDVDFTGGRANWVFAWKPELDAPVSGTLILGAVRTQAGELVPFLPPAVLGTTGQPNDGFWRGVVAAHAWYDLTDQLAVGIENDFFLGDDASEAVILPQLGWQPIEHLRLQLGAGWYHLGEQDEALLALKVDLFNPSPRRPGH